MSWKKQGMIFKADSQYEWMQSHTAFPTPIELDDRIRIYFASRDSKQQSSIGFVDVDKNDCQQVIAVSETPILTAGLPGTFDDCGVNPDCAIHHMGKIYLYYHGWTKCAPTPHRTTAGLAISEDNGVTFNRVSAGPLLDRCLEEPYMVTNPFVLKEDDTWHMWYMNVSQWKLVNDKYEASTAIRYAHSSDGIHFNLRPKDCIKPNFDAECTANASVLKENGIYKMWYCYRSSENFRGGSGSYRIGYAESPDAKNWTRHDQDTGIDITTDDESAFDSQMLAYPTVIDIQGKRLMFYNGNGFGQSGIGYAIWCN